MSRSLVLAFLICLTVAAPALGYGTAIRETSSDLALNRCQAFTQKLYHTNTGRLVEAGHKGLFEWHTQPDWVTHLGAGFTNTARRAIRAVQIRFTILDAAGTERAYYDALWRGRFEPGRRYDFTSTGYKTAPIVSVPIRSVACSVESVRFAPQAEIPHHTHWQHVLSNRS